MKFKPYPKYKPSGVEWLGDVPEGWKISRLKNVAEFRYGDSLASENRIDGDVDVFGSNGPVGTHSVANTFSPSIVIGRKGSFGKVTYSDNAAFAIDTTYFVDRSCTESDLRWLYYGLQTLKLDVFSQDTGVPGLSREDAYQRPMAVPLLDEQSTIATFLDRETAKIDTLITKQEKLIDLLKEKRQAVISHAVTKGLDPTVPMKPSGVEWLGDVPEHWELKRLKYLGDALIGLTYDPSQVVNEADGLLVLRSSNVQGGQIVFDDNIYVTKAIPEKLITRVGDVLICSRNGSRALIGKNAIIDSNSAGLTFGAFMTIYRSHFNPYLFWVFNSQIFKFQAGAFLTSTINQLTIANLYNFEVPFPSPEEQKVIVAHLDKVTIKIDTLIAKAQQAIALQKEHRTALISAAVTGKIDVRGENENRKAA